MPLFDGYDPASETPWHSRILPETTSDAVHGDTCSPYHSFQPIITVLFGAKATASDPPSPRLTCQVVTRHIPAFSVI